MRALPLLEDRRKALETCVFCPKLCRSACPVSNAEPRETLTPWGKMSLAWMAAQGDVPLDASHGHPAWACTGCLGCREACDHQNPVAEVLTDTRDALARQGVVPEGARRVLAGFAQHDAEVRAASRALAAAPPGKPSEPGLHGTLNDDSREALLVGCGYVRDLPRETREAIAVTARLGGTPVSLVPGCCGLPLRLAGDLRGFETHARAMAASLRGKDRVTVLDAGCARALLQVYPAVGAPIDASVELLVERAARALDSLARVTVPTVSTVSTLASDHAGTDASVHWHDPCQLGRGLGVYEAPRAVLGRALGRAPDEFVDHRQGATCSGGGGLLPVTMPEVAGDIAQARLASRGHAADRDPHPGRVVTACASSLRSLRRAARAGDSVDDLVSWIAVSLGISRSL